MSNKWLEGPYAPLPGDVTGVDLEVIGELPDRIENGRKVLTFADVLQLAKALDPARRRRTPWRAAGLRILS